MKRCATSLGVLTVLALATAAAASPRDFTAEVREVYAVAACGERAPASYRAAPIARHCKELARIEARWRRHWLAKAAPFFAEHVAGAPTTVIYPFGGGDASTMLAVYPAATDYTSLSLEGIGDPRPLRRLARRGPRLAAELARLRRVLAANLGWAWNTTNQLSRDSSASGAGIPGILAILLVALDVHGYEPLEVRYFELADDGSLAYLTQARVDAWDAAQAARGAGPRAKRAHELQRGIFNNVEIVFRKKGDPAAPKKRFRHIAADLSDAGLARSAAPLAYLANQPRFAAMTKAASYLFWRAEFSRLRAAFLARMTIMVSDDTGIPPRYAGPAGFEQQPFGRFHGTFFRWADQAVAREMVELWRSADGAPLRFKFGYFDDRRNPHLLITRKR